MSKSVVFACVAVVCWAFLPNLLERKLSGFHPAVILVLAYSVMLSLALIRLGHARYVGEAAGFPTGILLGIALITVLIWFAGDYSYIGALTSQGDLVTIMLIMAMSPPCATLVKMMWVGGLPNQYHIVAYVAVLIAVYFTAKGNTLAASLTP